MKTNSPAVYESNLVRTGLVAVAMMFLPSVVTAAQAPVNLGTAGSFAILAKSGISTVPPSANGRLLAQTAVTLDANVVTAPAAAAAALILDSSVALTDPWVYTIGQSHDPVTKTMRAPMSGSMQFYRIRSATSLTITGITISGNNVVITYKSN